jgi:hypothetical protein
MYLLSSRQIRHYQGEAKQIADLVTRWSDDEQASASTGPQGPDAWHDGLSAAGKFKVGAQVGGDVGIDVRDRKANKRPSNLSHQRGEMRIGAQDP